MTLEDATCRYGLSMEKLQSYAEEGFLHCQTRPDGSVDYDEEDFKKIGQIQSLTAIGMSPENLRLFFDLPENSPGTRRENADAAEMQGKPVGRNPQKAADSGSD